MTTPLSHTPIGNAPLPRDLYRDAEGALHAPNGDSLPEQIYADIRQAVSQQFSSDEILSSILPTG